MDHHENLGQGHERMHVIIAGAGIGGLAAALSCLRRGFEVTVLEQAGALQEVERAFRSPAMGLSCYRRWGFYRKQTLLE